MNSSEECTARLRVQWVCRGLLEESSERGRAQEASYLRERLGEDEEKEEKG